MNRVGTYVSAVLIASLSIGMLAGCGGQPAKSASATSTPSVSASATVSTAADQSQEELIADFKDDIANVPTYKSLTVTEEALTTPIQGVSDSNSTAAGSDASEATASGSDASEATAAGGDASGAAAVGSDASGAAAGGSSSTGVGSGTSEALKTTTVFKFDMSGDKLRTSKKGTFEDIAFSYQSDGDDVVYVTDGPIYGGTAKQFDQAQFSGVGPYLDDAIGKLDKLYGCITSIEKTETYGLRFYKMTLDPQKYMESDEVLKIMADSGNKVTEAVFSFGFDENGNIASIDRKVAYETIVNTKSLLFSDYNSTVVGPMPEATNTYEEMQADMQAKVDAMNDASQQV